MPFTLSHPAAVWPIRRIPYLATIPMIIGSLAPDLAAIMVPPGTFLPYYWLPSTHMLRGSFVVDLPFGYLLLMLLVLLRTLLTAPLWEPHRSFIRAAFNDYLGNSLWWLLAIPSLIIGSWTHIVWDAFTHEDRFISRHLTILQQPVLMATDHPMHLSHMLQYLSSIVGLIIIAVWYVYALRRSGLKGTGRRWRKVTFASVVVGALLLGAIRASQSPPEITASFYATVAVMLNTAMVSFTLLYIAAGTFIAWRTDHRSRHA